MQKWSNVRQNKKTLFLAGFTTLGRVKRRSYIA